MSIVSPIWAAEPETVNAIPVAFPGSTDPYYQDPGTGTVVAETQGNARLTVRTFFTGTAEGGLWVIEDAEERLRPAWSARWDLKSVWDVVLVDAIDDDVCPPRVRDAAIGLEFLGAVGTLQSYDETTNLEDGVEVQGTVFSNHFLASGIGGETLFRNLYVTLNSTSPGIVEVVPWVDGIRYYDSRQFLLIEGNTDEWELQEYEVPLVDTQSYGSYGLRGSWFQLEVQVVNLFDCGRVLMGGVEVEHEMVREGVEYRTFGPPPQTPRVIDFRSTVPLLGGGGFLAGYGGPDDNGAEIPITLQTSTLAPEGVGGEALFRNLYFTLYRENTSAMQLTITPLIDNIPAEAQTFDLPTVTELAERVYEMPLTAGADYRYGLRGTWFACIIETDVAPDGPFEVMGVEVEYERVRERTGQ